jgi:hypothetical protein
MKATSRIPVTEKTRELVKAQKTGGQTYDELLRLMVEQYDPDRGKI